MNKELIEELKAQDFNVVAVSKTRTKEEIDEGISKFEKALAAIM